MTRKFFWQDPYCSTLTTVITSISNHDITVADTIFYAFSGGQESDRGTAVRICVAQGKLESLTFAERTLARAKNESK